MAAELVTLEVKPGAAMESQSGLNQKWPRISGALLAPEGPPRAAAIVIHPTSNFHNHYLMAPLARRGVACFGLNTRYVANDVTLLNERAIQDLGAGVRFLRGRGYGRIVLIGNSGGAALVSLYQAQAERLTIERLVDGRPIDLVPEDLPQADAIALLAAHPGRARILADWLDPSVIDEQDAHGTDPALDLYAEGRAVPFEPGFLDAFRAAQRARRERIEAFVDATLRRLRAEPRGAQDQAFVIHRTHADPRFLDLTLDANRRRPGSLWGVPQEVNRAANAVGRFTTLTAFLSQWSQRSRADGPARLAETSVPVLHFDVSGDQSVFPSDNAAWCAAAAGRARGGAAVSIELAGGNHYLDGQPELVERCADALAEFAAGV